MTRTFRRRPRTRPHPHASRTWLAGAGLVGASIAGAAATTPAAWVGDNAATRARGR